tara:strand:- start:548 stop:1021 length:474 start_codon:yes stop_codon:yes gene_type:complete
MKKNYLNIYNNLIKLTRNKSLYLKLYKNDTFSDRLIILFFHFSFFLKYYKKINSKNDSQELFDFFIKQIELSIREIGYGDVSVNKKMKDFVNLFYSIVEKVENWDSSSKISKSIIISSYLNISKDLDFFVDYFEKYRTFLTKNALNNFTKDIINLKF